MADPQSRQPLMSGDGKKLNVVDDKVKADSYIEATKKTELVEKKGGKDDDVEVAMVGGERAQYIGLTKEDLQQYANDPFWKTLRIILFVLFWLAWIAMFAAAIFIVVVSPKCPERVVPQWWQRKVAYQVWTQAIQDSDGDGYGDLVGLTQRVDDLRRIGVQSVRVHPLLSYEAPLNDEKGDGYDITDFDMVDDKLGTNDHFKTLVEDIHDNDMFVIMDLPLTVTSNKHPWFNVSRNRAQPYSEYYIWRNTLPNSDYWEKLGDKFYMVHKERRHPILNWKHEPVRNEMAKIMKKWIERGVNGFFLPYVDYMSRDDDGKVNWPTIYGYLADLREVDNNTNILLYTDAPDASHDAKLPLVTDGKLNYVINNDLAFKTNDTCYTDREASCLYDKLKEALDHFIKYNETWPMWDIGNANMRRIASRSSGKDNANKGDFELWNMLLLMLPGSLNTYYGDEIGMTNGNQTGHLQQRTPMQWNEEKNAGFSIADNLPVKVNDNYKEINYKAQYYTAGTPLKSFRRLAKMRQIDDVMMSGMFKVAKKKPENNVFEFSRYIKLIGGGAPVGRVYVAALNFGNTAAKVEFDQTVLPIPVEERKKGHVVTASSKLLESGEYWPRKEIDMTAPLSLGPHEGIVLRFN